MLPRAKWSHRDSSNETPAKASLLQCVQSRTFYEGRRRWVPNEDVSRPNVKYLNGRSAAAAETNAQRKKSIRKFNQQVNQTFELKSASFEINVP